MVLASVGAIAIAVVYFAASRKAAIRSAATQSAASAAAPHPIRSIAVLPLDNFSGDPRQEYFADGMTDELTTELASISALRVMYDFDWAGAEGEFQRAIAPNPS